MKTRIYFAYGLNLNHEHMARSVPTADPIGPFKIEGYKVELLAFANIVKSNPEDYIWGGCWLIDQEAEKALDVIEGYPTLYKKITIDNILVYQMTEEERVFESAIDFTENEARESIHSSPYIDLIKQGFVDFDMPPETWERNLEGHK